MAWMLWAFCFSLCTNLYFIQADGENVSKEIFCECPQNLVKQRITPHFLTKRTPNYYEFTTKE